MEADIVIHDIKTVIEYNGIYWHTKARDSRKKDYITNSGYRLITILDRSVNKLQTKASILDENTIIFDRYLRDMEPIIPMLETLLNVKLNIDSIKKADIEQIINEKVVSDYGRQCLAYIRPDIAEELLIDDATKIFVSDAKTRIFKCKKCSMIYKTSVHHKVYNKSDCPYCAGNLAIPFKTDIVTLMPEYAKEIISLTEDQKRHTLPFSSKIVQFQCSACGYK